MAKAGLMELTATPTVRSASATPRASEPRVNFNTIPNKEEDSVPLPEKRVAKLPTKKVNLRHGPRVNAFTNLVERTIDGLRGENTEDAYEELRRNLATIRKQYDEVKAEAERRERELLDVRYDIRVLEAEAEYVPEFLPNSQITRADVLESIADVDAEIFSALETKKVYLHMVERLKRELMIVQQKIQLMDTYLKRKTHEVEKRQECSRRVHRDKVEGIIELEAMEQEIEMERVVCSAALEDLDTTLQQRKSEVRHKEEFERWRYEVAMEAATEAFQATSGRFRKIYAIEKLTGNCLQKIIFEQAEENQATEEGFQKIREVTGLQDVMDIVHKFLNRDSEHEQLKASVREAEVRLHSLREEEANRKSEATNLGFPFEPLAKQPLGLAQAVTEQEHKLGKAQRDHEMFQREIREEILLLGNIKQWSRRMTASLSTFDRDIEPIESTQGVVPFFIQLAETVDRFMVHAHSEMPTAKLSKLTSQAATKEYTEQQRLLTDKDFLRSNCRVPASRDPKPSAGAPKQARQQAANEDERQDLDVQNERDRLKQEAKGRVTDKNPHRSTISWGRQSSTTTAPAPIATVAAEAASGAPHVAASKRPTTGDRRRSSSGVGMGAQATRPASAAQRAGSGSAAGRPVSGARPSSGVPVGSGVAAVRKANTPR